MINVDGIYKVYIYTAPLNNLLGSPFFLFLFFFAQSIQYRILTWNYTCLYPNKQDVHTHIIDQKKKKTICSINNHHLFYKRTDFICIVPQKFLLPHIIFYFIFCSFFFFLRLLIFIYFFQSFSLSFFLFFFPYCY